MTVETLRRRLQQILFLVGEIDDPSTDRWGHRDFFDRGQAEDALANLIRERILGSTIEIQKGQQMNTQQIRIAELMARHEILLERLRRIHETAQFLQHELELHDDKEWTAENVDEKASWSNDLHFHLGKIQGLSGAS